jgi:putative NADH-flavin reductase
LKKILVFGAMGRTGAHLIDLALQRGLGVVALVRDPRYLTERAGLVVRKGTPTCRRR